MPPAIAPPSISHGESQSGVALNKSVCLLQSSTILVHSNLDFIGCTSERLSCIGLPHLV